MHFKKPGIRNQKIMKTHIRPILFKADNTTKYYKNLFNYRRKGLKGVEILKNLIASPHQ